MKDMGAMMKQAQAMQQKMQDAQAQLSATLFEGVAGNGLVKLTLTGAGELKAVTVEGSLLDPEEAEMVGDLIVAAHADAKKKIDDASAEMMRSALGPLAGMGGRMPGIPGLKF